MNKFHVTAILFFLSSFITGRDWFLGSLEWTSPSDCAKTVLVGIVTLLCITFGTIFLIISTQRTSKHYSLLEALHHFIVKYHRLYVGYKMLRKFRSCCEKPRKDQEALLQQIISRNKNTVYGRKFEIGNIKSLEDLRHKHPITDYDRYEAFVDRIAKGEKNVLTNQNVTRLVLTSGTTGKGKRIPNDEYLVDNIMKLQEALQQEKFSNLNPMQQRFKFHINAPVRQSEGGISITSATAVVPSMLKYMVVYSTPKESFMIEGVREATYVHLLFALRDRNAGPVFVTFSSHFLETMKFLEENWRKLVEDLSNGALNSDLELDPNVRSSLNRALGSGDPQRALEVQKEFYKGFEGILKRLWPHLNFIATIDNVGLRYRLKESFAKGLEIYSPIYVSSETLLGLNLWPFEQGEEEYALNLVDNVFEFIHEDEMDKPSPRTYFVDEVEVGQNYELIFTQSYGLYRYSFGDVIKVSGFYKNCPKVIFLYRKATLLNMVGEKTDQTVIQHSLEDALSPWSASVTVPHYTVAESTLLSDVIEEDYKGNKKSKLFYVFFLELKSIDGGELPSDLQEDILAEEIDKSIRDRHKTFKLRYAKYMARSKVYLVKAGTFNKLKEFILANTSASRAQFKMPLKLRTKDMAKIMYENIVRSPSLSGLL